MKKTADTVVIGGGAIGCSIAYHLAQKGAKVIVVEKKDGLCYGASGSNQGGVPVALFLPDSPILPLIQKSVTLYRALSEEIDYDIEYQQTGILICSVDEKQRQLMNNHAHGLQNRGIDARFIEGTTIRKMEPIFGDRVVAGVEDRESGIVNPFKVTYGYAYAAQKMSVEFLLSTSIYKIELSKSRVTSVITDKGRIETKSIVIAAGAWSPEIGNMVNLAIPIRPQRGQVLVTEPLPLNKRWRYICDADYLSIAFDTDRAEESNDVRLKLGVASNYIQKSNGTWTIGSSRDFAGYNNQVSIDTTRYLVKRMIKFAPKLKGTNCIRMYAGLRPFCYVDGLPIISNVRKISGLFIATGHAGEGITLAPITGKLIAELIIDNKSSMPIDAFSFSRFQNEAV